MPASRALPEPGEPPTAGARSPRRTPSRSEAKRGEAGCRRRPDRRYRQIGREAFHGAPNHPRRCPEASRKRTAKRGGGGLLRQTGMAIPAAHAPLAAVVQPLWRRGGRRGLRPPSLLRIHGRAPRARRPGSRRRHALEDPPGGSIADAAFAEAPSSARNAKGGRDPEARQARKGRNWHSGYQAPVGVDAGSGPVHTVGATAANVNDVVIACALVREDGPFCHAGSGYTGTGDSPRVASGLAGIGRNMPENALAGT